MAVIQFRPEVADYVRYLTLDEVAARPAALPTCSRAGR